jgi:hypothetical protein
MYPVEYRATRDSKLYHYVLQSVQGFEPTDLTIQETGFKMFERKKAGCLKKQKKKEMGQRLKKVKKNCLKCLSVELMSTVKRGASLSMSCARTWRQYKRATSPKASSGEISHTLAKKPR